MIKFLNHILLYLDDFDNFILKVLFIIFGIIIGSLLLCCSLIHFPFVTSLVLILSITIYTLVIERFYHPMNKKTEQKLLNEWNEKYNNMSEEEINNILYKDSIVYIVFCRIYTVIKLFIIVCILSLLLRFGIIRTFLPVIIDFIHYILPVLLTCAVVVFVGFMFFAFIVSHH